MSEGNAERRHPARKLGQQCGPWQRRVGVHAQREDPRPAGQRLDVLDVFTGVDVVTGATRAGLSAALPLRSDAAERARRPPMAPRRERRFGHSKLADQPREQCSVPQLDVDRGVRGEPYLSVEIVPSASSTAAACSARSRLTRAWRSTSASLELNTYAAMTSRQRAAERRESPFGGPFCLVTKRPFSNGSASYSRGEAQCPATQAGPLGGGGRAARGACGRVREVRASGGKDGTPGSRFARSLALAGCCAWLLAVVRAVGLSSARRGARLSALVRVRGLGVVPAGTTSPGCWCGRLVRRGVRGLEGGVEQGVPVCGLGRGLAPGVAPAASCLRRLLVLPRWGAGGWGAVMGPAPGFLERPHPLLCCTPHPSFLPPLPAVMVRRRHHVAVSARARCRRFLRRRTCREVAHSGPSLWVAGRAPGHVALHPLRPLRGWPGA